MDIDADLSGREGLNYGKEVHCTTGKAAALVDEHLVHGVCLHIGEQFHQRLPFLNLLGSAYLLGELPDYHIAHPVGVLPQFRQLTVVLLSRSAYSGVDAGVDRFHI